MCTNLCLKSSRLGLHLVYHFSLDATMLHACKYTILFALHYTTSTCPTSLLYQESRSRVSNTSPLNHWPSSMPRGSEIVSSARLPCHTSGSHFTHKQVPLQLNQTVKSMEETARRTTGPEEAHQSPYGTVLTS